MKAFIKGTIALTLMFTSFLVIGQSKFQADTNASLVYWKGSKPTGTHNGTIKLKSGYFTVENGLITAGEFDIDMNSIVNLDIPADEKGNKKLVGHLKSDDFFGVAKYPVANYKIISTEKKDGKTLIKGELTIKEKTHPVHFLATVAIADTSVILKSDTFKIDRSKWDIKFKSQSFFGDLGDNFIYDDIELSADVTAVK